MARVGKLKVGQGSFPRNFRRLFHLNKRNTLLHIWDVRKHTKIWLLFYNIDIDFDGGDADSVMLIAWHLAIDKSYVLALALLLYQESDIKDKLHVLLFFSFFSFFFFFFLGGGGGGVDDEWWKDDEWIMMWLWYMHIYVYIHTYVFW